MPNPLTRLFRRGTEATPEQLVATGALGQYGTDPIDGDVGYTQIGANARGIPIWTLRKARAYSIAAYRTNPMARSIVDTYSSFVAGDSGITYQCSNDLVREVVNEWWHDPRNNIGGRQIDLFRDHMLMGETVLEMLVASSGRVRMSMIDSNRVSAVELVDGNPFWPGWVHIDQAGERLSIVQVDDTTGLRSGQVQFFTSWKTLITDRRGEPFLMPILDALDAFDQVQSNLIDRTALARYLVWDVTVKGDQKVVDDFIAHRGGTHVPRSGSVEVHNEGVSWDAKTAQTGSFEDTNTLASILTNVAGGAGLARTWLADPSGANRATSMSMAEPVRRRVGGVQNLWLGHMTELARFVVDQAVAVGRLPAEVPSTEANGVLGTMIPSAQTVRVTGPEIAAADAQVTAAVLVNLATSLTSMVAGGILSNEAAAIAAQKGWEQFVGSPFRADLALDPNAADDIAAEIESAALLRRIA